jgi:hypothetical protein
MSRFEARARLKVRDGQLEGFKRQAAERPAARIPPFRKAQSAAVSKPDRPVGTLPTEKSVWRYLAGFGGQPGRAP